MILNRKIFILILSISCIFSACKKDKEILNSKQHPKLNSKFVKDIPSRLLPEVKNGILAFRDLEHFNDYLKFLNESAWGIDSTDTLNPVDTLDFEQKLDILESELGYTSLRKALHTKWDAIYDAGFTDLTKVPEDFYLEGANTRSVYNSNKNCMIGARTNHLYSEDVGILLLKVDMNKLDVINTLPDGLTLNEVETLLASDHDILVYNTHIDGIDFIEDYTTKSTNDTTWETNNNIQPLTPLTWCSGADNRKVTIKNITLTAQGVDQEQLYHQGYNNDALNVSVDWGDGTTDYHTIYLQYNYLTYFSWPNLPSGHQYSTGGNKTITMKIKRPYHTGWVAELTKTINVPTYACNTWTNTSNSDNPWIYKYSTDGKRAVSGKAVTHPNWFSNPVFEAHSKAWKLDGGVWKHKKAERIVAQLWFDTYVDCGSTADWNHAADWPYNDKTVQVQVTKGSVLANSTYNVIYSNHQILYNGSYVSLDLSTPRCHN